MTTDFTKYKAEREARKVQKELAIKEQETQVTKSYDNDDKRFWKPTMDKEKGVGGAVIRFLPDANQDNLFGYVSWFYHNFKNPANDKWYIERSLTSLKELGKDAIYALNGKLYKSSGNDKNHPNRKASSLIGRKQQFVSNIQVVHDPANPDNNGKVFLYKFGKAIYNKIDAVQFPIEDAITGKKPDALDPFDIIDGANFEIRIKNTENGWNYDDSKFASSTPLATNDAVFNAVLSQLYDLSEFVSANNYKTNAELDKRLIEVLGSTFYGFEVVEGYVGTATQTQAKNEKLDAPTQDESSASDLPFEPDAPSNVSFATDADEEFFNNLMSQT